MNTTPQPDKKREPGGGGWGGVWGGAPARLVTPGVRLAWSSRGKFQDTCFLMIIIRYVVRLILQSDTVCLKMGLFRTRSGHPGFRLKCVIGSRYRCQTKWGPNGGKGCLSISSQVPLTTQPPFLNGHIYFSRIRAGSKLIRRAVKRAQSFKRQDTLHGGCFLPASCARLTRSRASHGRICFGP
jgi:hypothetical protein